jgi:hypothetical protein
MSLAKSLDKQNANALALAQESSKSNSCQP